MGPAVEQPEPDFGGGGAKGLADRSAAVIGHQGEPCHSLVRRDIAGKDPRMALGPALGASFGDPDFLHELVLDLRFGRQCSRVARVASILGRWSLE